MRPVFDKDGRIVDERVQSLGEKISGGILDLLKKLQAEGQSLETLRAVTQYLLLDVQQPILVLCVEGAKK